MGSGVLLFGSVYLVMSAIVFICAGIWLAYNAKSGDICEAVKWLVIMFNYLKRTEILLLKNSLKSELVFSNIWVASVPHLNKLWVLLIIIPMKTWKKQLNIIEKIFM